MIFDYLMRLLPIAIGALAAYMLTKINISSRKVSILPSTSPSSCPAEEIRFDSIDRKLLLRKYSLDELIINGKFETLKPNIELLAFYKLGLIDATNYSPHRRYIFKKIKRIKIFLIRKEELSNTMAFGSLSGIIMAYMLGYKLDLVCSSDAASLSEMIRW